MNETDVAKAVRVWAEARHVDRAHLDRWLALDAESARALLEAAAGLKLRVGQLRSALELLEEIALVDRTQAAAVLARQGLKRILEGVGPAPERARAFVEELRAMRFPRLGRTLGRIRAEVAALGLPRTIGVTLPKDLGSDELKIEIRVRSGAEFRESLRELADRTDGMERILDLLGGES